MPFPNPTKYSIACINMCTMGKCKSDCCGVVPMKKVIVEKHKDKFQVEIEEEFDMGDEVAIATKDNKCIFLDREKNKCTIYEDRPQVCRLFGYGIDADGKENVLMYCPHLKPNGNQWSEAKAKQLQRRVDVVLKDTMNKLDERHKLFESKHPNLVAPHGNV